MSIYKSKVNKIKYSNDEFGVSINFLFHLHYLTVGLYHLLFNNGCVEQPDGEITENFTIGSQLQQRAA